MEITKERIKEQIKRVQSTDNDTYDVGYIGALNWVLRNWEDERGLN